MDFTTNYCGMYYSDGKIQSSVADGASVPVNALDEACREHDTAYANALDDQARNAADDKFYQVTNNLGFKGKTYGRIVKYGNQVTRKGKMAFFMPLAMLIGASAGSTALLSGMLPKKGKLRGSAVAPDAPILGTVYDPGSEGAPSGGDFVPAIGKTVSTYVRDEAPIPSKAGSTEQESDSLWNATLRDPGLMQPIRDRARWRPKQAPTEQYRPLKRKQIKKTPSMVKLHLKYNPPKNKTNKIFVSNSKNG